MPSFRLHMELTLTEECWVTCYMKLAKCYPYVIITARFTFVPLLWQFFLIPNKINNRTSYNVLSYLLFGTSLAEFDQHPVIYNFSGFQ